jgi:hypothetical protein
MSTHSGVLKYTAEHIWDTVFIPYAVSQAALNAFAAAIQVYSGAELDSVGFVSTDHPHLLGNLSTFTEITWKARVNLKRSPLEGDSTDYRQVVIVAPVKSMCEYDHARGNYKVKDAAGQAIATAYSALTGITYVFKDGYLCSG